MNQISLKSMQPVDLPQVVAIANEVNLGVWQVDDYLQELKRKNSYLLTAKQCQTVVGFIAVRFTFENSAEESICPEADIINIGVLKNHQKKGIGSLLLNKFIMRADKLKIKIVWLEVRESNTAAQNFYRLNGFVQVQKRKNFYARPLEDALIMRFDLTGNLKIRD